MGGKGGIHHPKDQQGCTSKSQPETNQLERAVVSQRRDASPSRACPSQRAAFPLFFSPAGSAAASLRNSHLCPQAPWRLPPPARAGDDCSARRVQRTRAEPRGSTARLHAGGPGTRARPSQSSLAPPGGPPAALLPAAQTWKDPRPALLDTGLDLPHDAQQAPAWRQRYLGVSRAKLRRPELEAELQLPEPSAGRGSRHRTPLPRGLRGTRARWPSPLGADDPAAPRGYWVFKSVEPLRTPLAGCSKGRPFLDADSGPGPEDVRGRAKLRLAWDIHCPEADGPGAGRHPPPTQDALLTCRAPSEGRRLHPKGCSPRPHRFPSAPSIVAGTEAIVAFQAASQNNEKCNLSPGHHLNPDTGPQEVIS